MLQADGDIALLAARDKGCSASQNEQRGANAGIGSGVGSDGASLYATADVNAGDGHSQERSTAWTETQVNPAPPSP